MIVTLSHQIRCHLLWGSLWPCYSCQTWPGNTSRCTNFIDWSWIKFNRTALTCQILHLLVISFILWHDTVHCNNAHNRIICQIEKWKLIILCKTVPSVYFSKRVCSSASEIDIMTNIDSQTITGYFFFQTWLSIHVICQ